MKLGVRKLPQHEIADAMFARRPNHEFWVRQIGRLEVFVDGGWQHVLRVSPSFIMVRMASTISHFAL